jgi:hypothetical protein
MILNILKTYYENVHQDKPRPTHTDDTDRLQLALDIRQDPLQTSNIRRPKPRGDTHTGLTHQKRTDDRPPEPHGSVYLSLIPQVDYTDGPTPVNPTKPPRTLLAIPTHKNIPSIPPTHPTKCSLPELTEHPPNTTTRAVSSPKKARTEDPLSSNPEHTHTHLLTSSPTPLTPERPTRGSSPERTPPTSPLRNKKWMTPPETGCDNQSNFPKFTLKTPKPLGRVPRGPSLTIKGCLR